MSKIMSERKLKYKSDKLNVTYAPEVCIHAAECVNGLPNVFNPKAKPWVNIAGADPSEIIDVINKCPSGALEYELLELETEKKEIELEKTKITVMPNGPVMVEGDLTIKKMSGENIKDAEKVFLCRCGQSANKPFCDGAHKKADFQAE